MNNCIIVVCVVIKLTLVNCDRGTIPDPEDEPFHMLVAGGFVPDNARLTRHVVSIRTLNMIEYPGDNHFCAGVILSSQMILTAAHCVTDRFRVQISPRRLSVVFGTLRRLSIIGPSDQRRIDHIIVHPGYRRYIKNDLALLHLAKRIPSNVRHVKPISKRKEVNLTIGLRCTTLGWGQIFPHGPYANEIMFLDVLVSNHSVCDDAFDDYVAEGNLCMTPDASGAICAGDMGGPLLCDDCLVGIVGGVQACEGIVAIKFVNYSHFEPWVVENLHVLTDDTVKNISLSWWHFSGCLIILEIFNIHYVK